MYKFFWPLCAHSLSFPSESLLYLLPLTHAPGVSSPPCTPPTAPPLPLYLFPTRFKAQLAELTARENKSLVKLALTAKGSVKHRKRCLGMWNAFTRWLKENHSFEKAEDFLQFYLDEATRVGEIGTLIAAASVHKAQAGKQVSRRTRVLQTAAAAAAAAGAAAGGGAAGAEEEHEEDVEDGTEEVAAEAVEPR